MNQKDITNEAALLDAATFIRLCRLSAMAWERGNNSGNPRTLEIETSLSEGYIERAEKIARKWCCKASWPGLYPVLEAGERSEYGTEDRARVARFFLEGIK